MAAPVGLAGWYADETQRLQAHRAEYDEEWGSDNEALLPPANAEAREEVRGMLRERRQAFQPDDSASEAEEESSEG
jgi:hypothetical protein